MIQFYTGWRDGVRQEPEPSSGKQVKKVNPVKSTTSDSKYSSTKSKASFANTAIFLVLSDAFPSIFDRCFFISVRTASALVISGFRIVGDGKGY